ncbi:MAG: prepilin-type N-terminal cleavage/methylation domain-containing protein [Elusimicrobiaceae bacterium]|jgi:prepilin-type N-terminal cleavage/methylation domain-containing protein|nr:prepilin-type N-terminal cleavage/methylation domain-containing protein [Elusimicrobiaceae bacterium]MBT4008181.1 prepilin-type N-terminal cleavage/methylation domain-containing protein [Elusimicrobiaceae bacterium]MBT4402519.1 prepilin-type N-terminal cleavage/methylation domain-containing protein [Elusimicrobiaceae bacterium]MBT4439646.1 prepilin-type N-terminal cleavage/methylation domain-containing protein [Elusimicrobiaceae bacterium]MBT5988060.1 prepilin-type N-terminal cleavage/methyl
MKIKNNFAFTLVELLIVCVVLSLLASFAITSYQKAVEDSRNDKAKQTLRKVATAYDTFDYEYPGRCLNEGIVVKSSGTCSVALDNLPTTLINCKYMENEDWDDDPYQYEICGTDCNASTTAPNPSCCASTRWACASVKSDSASQTKAGDRYTDDDYAIIYNKTATTTTAHIVEGAYLL